MSAGSQPAPPSGGPGPTRGLAGFVAGFALPLRGVGLLWRERSLRSAAAVPFLFSLFALAAAVWAIVAWGPEFHGLTGSWFPELRAARWYAWLWVGPLLGIFSVARWLLVVAAAAFCAVMAFLLASVAAAPFHEVLSQRVERLVTGSVVEVDLAWSQILGDGLRAVLEDLRRLVIFVALQVGLGVGGFFLTPLAPIFAALALLTTLFFLPLDYSSYLLDRRRVLRFREKRNWLWRRAAPVLGFGSAAFAVSVIPGLNFIAMPVLVIGGTLLALRFPPTPEAERERVRG